MIKLLLCIKLTVCLFSVNYYSNVRHNKPEQEKIMLNLYLFAYNLHNKYRSNAVYCHSEQEQGHSSEGKVDIQDILHKYKRFLFHYFIIYY